MGLLTIILKPSSIKNVLTEYKDYCVIVTFKS